jgi:hypothetical protein
MISSEMVQFYNNFHRPILCAQRDRFESMWLSNPHECIREAASCINHLGKIDSHQRYVHIKEALPHAFQALLEIWDDLEQCNKDAEKILIAVVAKLLTIPNIGPLTRYDIYIRILWAWRLDLPYILVQAGALKGARLLNLPITKLEIPGVKINGSYKLTREDLPFHLCQLDNFEVNQFLCVMNKYF